MLLRKHYERKTCVGVRYLLWQEQAMARHRIRGIKVRLCEHPWDTETRVRREREWQLVQLQVLSSNVSAR